MAPKNGYYIFSEAFTSWLIGIIKKSCKERHFCAILRGCLKKEFLHLSGLLDCLLCAVPYIYIYMVQYAIFGKFCQNVRNLRNFDFAPICYKIHHMSCWMSLTASHILESYRMGSFLQESFPFFDFLRCFLRYFAAFAKSASIWICHIGCFNSLAINMLHSFFL